MTSSRNVVIAGIVGGIPSDLASFSVTRRLSSIVKGTSAAKPINPATIAIPNASGDPPLARRSVRRAADVECGQPAPPSHFQRSHSQRLVGTMAHGTVVQYFWFSTTNADHGATPASATAPPMRVAPRMIGSRRQSASIGDTTGAAEGVFRGAPLPALGE